MTTPGKTDTRQGTKPEWLNLPRKRCKTCPRFFKPNRPNADYCSRKCKDDYNRHGAAFPKLKEVIGKEIKRQMNLTETCPTCKPKHRHAKRNPNCSNRECRNGKVLTEYGRTVLQALREFAPAETAALENAS